MEAKWHCHRRRRSLQRHQAVPFRQESPVTPRMPLHPYGFRDKSLREGNSSPLSKNFGKNLNMNTPKRLDHCKEQLNAKPHAQSCCHATNENKVKVPHTPLTVYFPIDARERVNFFYRLDYLYETWHTCSACSWLQNLPQIFNFCPDT